MAISTLSLKLLIHLQPNLVLYYSIIKIGLLHSRSRSQQRFKMLVNVCLDDIFWTREHFVTKLGMVMQHHDPECHAEKNNCLLSSLSRSQQRLMWSKYDSFYYIFWTVDSLATKLGLMIHYHKPECLVKKMDNCIQGQGHSEGSNCQCLSIWYLLKHWTFLLLNFVLWCLTMSWSACKKLGLLFSRSRS